jgi:hypothetical protein
VSNSLKVFDRPVFEDGMVAYRYFDDSTGFPTLAEYGIIKRTAKGFKIEDEVKGVTRQVFVGSSRQYAYEDKFRALEAYKNRKIKQRLILEKQLIDNKIHFDNIKIVERELEKEEIRKLRGNI